jgi:hypothetical protein
MPTDRRRLVRLAASGEADTAIQLTRQLTWQLRDITNVEYNVYTVCHALKEAGLRAVGKKKRL